VAGIERGMQYVVFQPEWSFWGPDLSFSGLIWQGLFSSSNSKDSKDIYVFMAVPVSFILSLHPEMPLYSF
jgi:hypothetical protein